MMKSARRLLVLREFLSPHNLAVAPTPRKHTANTIKALYTSVRSSALHRLDPDMFSSLISLFGSLSVPPSETASAHAHPFLHHMNQAAFRPHWPFILMVASDKTSQGCSYTPSDHYWLMRASIANVHTHSEAESPTADPARAISLARNHYRQICGDSADPNVHVPFIQVLLSTRSRKFTKEVAERLSILLSNHNMFHSRLRELLWEVIVRYESDLSPPVREKLLAAIWHRITKRLELANPLGSHPLVRPDDLRRLRIASVAHTLSAGIFAPVSQSDAASTTQVDSWSIAQLFSAFDPKIPSEARWKNLVLLALAHHPRLLTDDLNRFVFTAPTDRSRSGGWHVIIALAALDRMLGARGVLSAEDGGGLGDVRTVVRSVWNGWVSHSSIHSRPCFVARAIAISFLRLCTITGDAKLKDTCHTHCVLSHLLEIDGSDKLARVQVTTYANEYGVASAMCGEDDWQVLFLSLSHIYLGTDWRSKVTNLMITRLSRLNAHVAHHLFVFSDSHVIELHSSTLHALGVALISEDLLALLLPILGDTRLSLAHLQDLVNYLIRNIKRRQHKYLDPQLAAALGKALFKLHTASPPPLTTRRNIHYILPVISASGQPSKATSIVQAINQTSPWYLTSHFFYTFLRTLIRHRRFRLASLSVESVPGLRPRLKGALRTELLVGLANGGASRLARETYSRGVPISARRRFFVGLARTLNFNLRAPGKLSLRIPQLLNKQAPPTDGAALRLAVQALLRAGRVLAAKKLFDTRRRDLDAPTRTIIGNMILHSALLRQSRRNGRQMRKLLSTMNFLVREQDFVVDRVSVNVLVKGLLQWRTKFTSRTLRALFDQLVRSGYRMARADGEEEDGVPFGTPSTDPPVVRLPEMSSAAAGVSFERHIRPMYKMFIKHFYLRSDVTAASTVVGLLKDEERHVLMRRVARGSAQMEGRLKQRDYQARE